MEQEAKSFLVYTGIGSRSTPLHVGFEMTATAIKLDNAGYTLRSGGADGADTAFEAGATKKEIYLPWKDFNGHLSPLYNIPEEAFVQASKIHPAWNKLSDGGRKLHARNVQQVLGQNLKHPSMFVLCWHNNTGGTMQAVRVAEAHGIPVLNMKESDWKERLDLLLQG
jgi:hypothetical protein